MEDNKDSSEKQTNRRSKKTKTIGAVETLNSGETTARHIPQEIIEEILLRLPVKSLLKFKCVARSWLALISSPKFIKTQVKYSTNLDPALSNYRIMFSISPTDRYDVKCRSVSSVYCDFMSDAVDVDFPSTQTNWVTSIAGSCDGLLCVGVYDLTRIHMFLWNPCLRMSKKPPLPIAEVEQGKFWQCAYGIGYDMHNDDYKVVAVGYDHFVAGYLVEIYSLKNNSWKRIESFKDVVPLGSSMIYANGNIHFSVLLVDNNTSTGDAIVSLDLGTEAFRIVEHPEVDQPKCNNKYHFNVLSIGVLKGCISALYSYAQENKFAVDYVDLWVLKEYGVKESWTKLARISRVHEYIGCYNATHILDILTDGKVLLGRGEFDDVVVYNPEDDSFVCTQIRNAGPIRSMGIYVESLVPLPA